MSDATMRVEARITGRVQGVGFRFHVDQVAITCGLSGWVANGSDGSVQCVAEGPRDRLELFVRGLEEGPRGAHVEAVSVRWGPASGSFSRFEIRSGGHGGD